MTTPQVQVVATQFKGMKREEIISNIASNRTITIAMLTNDITVLQGTMPTKGSKKEEYAKAYAEALVKYVNQNKKNKKEKSTMTQQQPTVLTADQTIQLIQAQVTPIYTQLEAITKTMETMATHMTTVPTVSATPTAEQPKEETMEEKAKKAVAVLNQHYGKEVVTIYTPIEVLQSMCQTVRAELATKKETSVEQPQYTKEQLDILETVKGNPEQYNRIKEFYDGVNKTCIKVYGSLHNVADQIDNYGHKGVDGIGNLLDSLIDGLAVTAKSAAGIVTQVGHVGVDGVSGTVRFVGDVVNGEKK